VSAYAPTRARAPTRVRTRNRMFACSVRAIRASVRVEPAAHHRIVRIAGVLQVSNVIQLRRPMPAYTDIKED
jgi:hypothetical protein